MYDKNNLSKYSKRVDFNEMIDNFFQRNVKKQSPRILKKVSDYLGFKLNPDNESFSNRSQLSIRDKVTNYTNSFDSPRTSRLETKEKLRNKNIDIFECRYNDICSNNQVINFLPKFKKLWRYNTRVQNIFEGKTENQTSNGINVLKKVNDFKKYLKLK
jgi:hypothetical protein